MALTWQFALCKFLGTASLRRPGFSRDRCLSFLQNVLHGYVVLIRNNVRPVRKKDVVQVVTRRGHPYKPCQRCVEHCVGSPVLQIPNSMRAARYKSHSCHISHPSYSVTSGFITKVPRVCEELVDVCGLSLRALTEAFSTGPLNFAMYPERAVGLIFIPFSPSR